jgi:hypothetical protein
MEIRPGDVSRVPAEGEALAWRHADHGHGHIAIQEQLDGKVVEWMEKVSDEQYEAVQPAGTRR